jgi:hypothetical protein
MSPFTIPHEADAGSLDQAKPEPRDFRDRHAVLALLAALRGQRAPAAARALADLFNRRLLLQASEC